MGDRGTVWVCATAPVISELQRRRVPVEPVLRRAQISRDALASADNRIPYDCIRGLWEEAARAAGDEHFGVHAAEIIPIGGYDLVDYLVSVAGTVGEGLTRLTKYVRLFYDRSNLRLQIEPRNARVLRRVELPAPQYDEFTMVRILTRCRQASGVRWAPQTMAFQHQRPADDRELARVFSCPLAFGKAESEMRLEPSILELPNSGSDSHLLSILSRYADTLLSTLPSRGDLVAEISSAIARQMTRGLPSLPSTALMLHLPKRTLQRKLAHAGMNHSSLVEEVRRGLALKYIGDAGLSIGEISYLLHYADATAFNRAFKRWTGDAPAQYRQRLYRTSPS